MPLWEHLDVDRPHLAYIIIGGFTSLFMLCSSFVKEKLYIGEATVATAVGIIFGPYAAGLFDPTSWGNTDKITLEVSRIVLVVQCFAIGVELPKAYMERHWRSVTFLLVPVMTYGWLVTSLFIWWMIEPLTWLESLAVAACVTATDPVLASSVVGKGKFAKRVPRHLRDVLSAESGCNDGMAFPFIYLSVYLIHYHLSAREVVFHWFCYTILYECILGAVYGFTVGYIARHLIRAAHERDLIDRESFLVFYFVLALFVAGTGSTLGLDDLLVGFATGIGFSNDGWFQQKTEESHVSNVIDLLLNLAYFVYFGAIIPWNQFNNPALGLIPWKLVVIALFVLLFRRIPIMLALKPIIPDVKNWREALFAGHFGPIGVGAIFAAMLARAELEDNGTQPLAVLPEPGEENYLIVQIIWPVVTFLVIISIIVHGSSIAVFTLGKRINTLTLTMSYTTANEPSWLNRLPRIASTSRSMSKGRTDDDIDEKIFPGGLPPIGFKGAFLRRQKEEDTSRAGSRAASRSSSIASTKRKKHGPGGPISQSAIAPRRREEASSSKDDTSSETPDEKDQSRQRSEGTDSPEVEAYEEGGHLVIEDKEGNVLRDVDIKDATDEEKMAHIEDEKKRLRNDASGKYAKNRRHPHERNEGQEIEEAALEAAEHPDKTFKSLRHRLGEWNGWKEKLSRPKEEKAPTDRIRGPAHAYQYGNTVIVEDEFGEVVRKYDIPRDNKKTPAEGGTQRQQLRQGLQRMSTWTGFRPTDSAKEKEPEPQTEEDDDDRQIRFTVGGSTRRLSKHDFIRQISNLDPKFRAEAINESDAPEDMKEDMQESARPTSKRGMSELIRPKPAKLPSTNKTYEPASASSSSRSQEKSPADIPPEQSPNVRRTNEDPLNPEFTLTAEYGEQIPLHAVGRTVSHYSQGQPETPAARRRRLAAESARQDSSRGQTSRDGDSDSDDDGTERVPPGRPVGEMSFESNVKSLSDVRQRRPSASASGNVEETAAEKKRRLAALGKATVDSDSDEDGEERNLRGRKPVQEPSSSDAVDEGPKASEPAGRPGIRFAEDVREARGGGLATYRSYDKRK